MERLRSREFRDHVAGNRRGAYFFRVILAACGPDTGFSALDRKFAGDRQPVLHIEARTAELADPRGDLNHVTEFDGLDEICSCVHKRNSQDAEGTGKVRRLDPKCGLEQLPRARVEYLEESAVEHDARGIALAPFDCELLAIGKRHHALASRHETFRVIAVAFPAVMPGRIAIKTATSFSSCFSLGLAIRRLPATAFRRATRGA